jgi:cytochrome c biogenesis protein CcmG/thiol:disulfide interchange protein DsbE
MKRLIFLVPITLFVVLAVLFFRGLNGPPPDALPSTLLGKFAPPVMLPPLDNAAKGFTSADLKAGHVTVVNVWASWCVPCRAEAPALAAIARSGRARLFGIVYEDKPGAARAFLKEVGDPFSRLDLDADGRAGIAWGITGVPETFVVDGRGMVRLRYAGPVVADTLSRIIMPAIASAGREG